MHWRKVLPLVLLIAGGASMLASCSDPPERIESPESWQTHLTPANLGPDFIPAVTETIYVPLYSHIYHENKRRVSLLASTLSIRNTDASKPIILKALKYYSTDGTLLTDLLQQPVTLGPMATAEVVIPRTHVAGGSGANFVVEWVSQDKVSDPLAEAVMISTGSAKGISFVSRGVVTNRTEGKPKTP